MAAPFRPLAPYTEGERALFFGRDRELHEITERLLGDKPNAVLVGEVGVGKTSLVRAGLLPALEQKHVGAQYVDAAEAARAQIHLRSGGGVLVIDDVGAALDNGPKEEALLALLRKAGAVDNFQGGAHVLFVVDDDDLWRFESLEGKVGRIGGRFRLERLQESMVAEVLERTVLAGGAYFESGLSSVIATDLAKKGPVSPAEVQLVASTVLALRLNTAHAYRTSGGAEVIGWRFFERACELAGRGAERVLAEVAAQPPRGVSSSEAIADAAGLHGVEAARVAGVLERESLLTHGDTGYSLTSEWLRPRARAYTGEVRGRRVAGKLLLRRKLDGKKLLRFAEVREVKRFAGRLDSDEAGLVRRSVQLGLAIAAVVLAIPVGATVSRYLSYAGSYYFDAGAAPGAPLVVRLGRAQMSLGALPHRPPFGGLLSDTGFERAALKGELPEAGKLGDDSAWVKPLLSALRPLPHGISSLVLDGDLQPLTEAYQKEPAARAAVIEAVGAVGRGSPGELALLETALGEPSEDLRRRAVGAAAALCRRGAAATAPLEKALVDTSPSVRAQAVAEIAQLPDEQAAPLLAMALGRTTDPIVRKSALEAIAAQVARTPAAASSLGRAMAGGARAEAAPVLSRLLDGTGPSAQAAEDALVQVALDQKAPEEARLEALRMLRTRPSTPAALSGVAGTPRVMAAVMPLMARANAAAAQQQVLDAMKGPVPLRAAAAATIGLLPKGADTPKQLKVLGMDSAVEVRAEAVRALPVLGREALPLIMKEAKSGGADVERAAVETMAAQSAKLGPSVAVQSLEAVAHGSPRPTTRLAAVAALGRLGDSKAPLVAGALGRLLRDKVPEVRAAAAAALGDVLGHKSDKADASRDAVSSLKAAARDADVVTRRRAAEALGRAQGPSAPAAAKALAGFAADADPSVRLAAAQSLGGLGASARGAGAFAALVADKDPSVRAAGRKAAEQAGAADLDKVLLASFVAAPSAERLDIAVTAAVLGAPGTLRAALADADSSVRRAAAEHASNLDEAHAAVLVAALGDTDAAVRVAAVRGLVGARAAEALAQAARGTDLDVRVAALEALGRVGGPVAKSTLEEAQRDGSERVRAAAARGLGWSSDGAADPLLRALEDGSLDVRESAVAALGTVWSARPAAELKAPLYDETRADLRWAAALALAARAQPQKGAGLDALKLLDESSAKAPPLVQLSARVARAFVGRPEAMAAFLHLLREGG
jgi:HEAT repeat protein